MSCECEKPCFVHCVYCGADCELPEPPHAEDCPAVTGVFPVRPEDLGHECVHCGERTPGMACTECHEPFEVGDSYMHQPTDQEDVKLIVCVGCAALEVNRG